MNLRTLDLNLLVVLEALLEEAHVTRAAERLGLSQPATSNALERLRHLFGDPLLERNRRGMRLTPRAEALRDPLREALRGIANVVASSRAADLSALRQPVRLIIADYGLHLFVADLRRRLQADAPGLDLICFPWHGSQAALETLERSESDLVVSVLPDLPATFRRVMLLHEDYVVVMRRGHPAAARFDLDRWLAFPHVVVSGRGDPAGIVDAMLAPLGRSRRVAVTVPSFLLVPRLLMESDLIALLPQRCVKSLRREPGGRESGLVTKTPPLHIPGYDVQLAWHSRRDHDAAVQHVRHHLQALARS